MPATTGVKCPDCGNVYHEDADIVAFGYLEALGRCDQCQQRVESAVLHPMENIRRIAEMVVLSE